MPSLKATTFRAKVFAVSADSKIRVNPLLTQTEMMCIRAPRDTPSRPPKALAEVLAAAARAKDTPHPIPIARGRATNTPFLSPGRCAHIPHPRAPTIVSRIKITIGTHAHIHHLRVATTIVAPRQVAAIAVRRAVAVPLREATPAPLAPRVAAAQAAVIRLLRAHRVAAAEALVAVQAAAPLEVVAEAAKLEILIY